MTSLINDPEHWRKRANEARELALQIPDPEQRRLMQEISIGYDRIAQHAETQPVVEDA